MERSSSLQRVSSRGFIPFLLLLLFIPAASGLGVGASPDKIEFGVVCLNEGAIRELYVINTGNEAERVVLKVDGVNLSVDPQSFDLDAKESRAVKVSIDPKETGEYTGSILITARPHGDDSGGLGLGAGVRIPVSFQVKDNTPVMVLAATGLFILVAAVAIVWMRRLKV